MMSKISRRTDRIGDLIQQALANFLQRNTDDPRFKDVTLTRVIVSKDVSMAKIFFTVLENTPVHIKKTTQALNHATGFFRFHLKDHVKLRILPTLKFYYDEALIKSHHLVNLIEHLDEPHHKK